MALLKMDMKFSLGSSGWRETYWVDPSSATPENYLTTAVAFSDFRIRLLCKGATLEETSILNPLVPRHSVVTTTKNSFAPGFDQYARDVQDAGVRVKLESSDRKTKRFLWLRGVPDRLIGFTNNRQVFTQEGILAIRPFLAAVISLPSVIRSASRVGRDLAATRIAGIATNAAGTRVVIQVNGHGYVGGEVVTIAKVKFLHPDLSPTRAVNGTHTVIPAIAPFNPANAFEINVPPGQMPPGDYTGTGLVFRRFLTSVPVVYASAERWASHSTGRPIVNTRGRRAVRRQFGIVL